MKTTLRVGDRSPALEVALREDDGTVVDLTGATVTARMVNLATGATKIADAAAVVDSAAEGFVSYAWGASDTDTPGDFDVTFRVSVAGLPRTFPAAGAIRVEILPR